MPEYICIGYGSKRDQGCGSIQTVNKNIFKYIWSIRTNERFDYLFKCTNCGLYNSVCKSDIQNEDVQTIFNI